MIVSDTRLAALDQLYALYDRLTDGRAVACRRFCAACCTCNVTLTRLEALRIMAGLDATEKQKMRENLENKAVSPRFVPNVTLNRLADICVTGGEPPEETVDPSWGPCPLLENQSCSIYAVRPFGCRCMSSLTRCMDAGAANMDDFTITLNQVFLQAIEHLDRTGSSGNLTDMLADALSEGEGNPPSAGLVPNSPISALLIPPGHRKKIQPILAQIQSLLT